MIKRLIKIAPNISSIIQLTLAIATLILSLSISREQNRISKLQYSPVFILSIEQLFNNNHNPTQSEKFDIINEGYPVNNFDDNFNSIMEVTYVSNYKLHQKKFKIDYFSVHFSKSGGKERMAGGIGENNILMFSNLENKIKEKLIKNGATSVGFTLHHLVGIRYTDTDLVTNNIYFLDSQRVTKEKYNKSLEGINDSYIISLYEPNIDEIISMIQKK